MESAAEVEQPPSLQVEPGSADPIFESFIVGGGHPQQHNIQPDPTATDEIDHHLFGLEAIEEELLSIVDGFEHIGDALVKDKRGPTFGKADGEEVSNKHTALRELDELISNGRPPDLELIFTEPYSLVGVGVGLTTNPYGHVSVRYRQPSGESKVMNIVGFGKGAEMVNFVDPADFFFGTNDWLKGNEQGGIYNRNFVSVRIEKVEQSSLDRLHKFYTELQHNWRQNEVKYSLMASSIQNWFSGKDKHGNCSFWTGHGLKEAGFIDHSSMWPKELWLRLYTKFHRFEKQNFLGHEYMHIVAYRRIPGCNSYGADKDPSSWVKPLRWYSSHKYGDLTQYADVIVSVPDHSRTVSCAHIHSSLRKRKGGNIKVAAIDSNSNLYCTNFWRKIPAQALCLDTEPERHVYRSIKPKFIAAGPSDVWIVTDTYDIFTWEKRSHGFLEYGYRQNLRVLLGHQQGQELPLPPVIQIIAGGDDSVFILLQGGHIVCLKKGTGQGPQQQQEIEEKASSVGPTSIRQIAIVNQHDLWAIDATDHLYHYSHRGWANVPDVQFAFVAAAHDGTTWALDHKSNIFRKDALLKTAWHEVGYARNEMNKDNWFVELAVADANNIWALDKAGMAYVWEASDEVFSPLGNISEGDDVARATPHRLKHISINAAGIAWGITHKDEVFVLSRHRLQIQPARDFVRLWNDEGTGCKPWDVGFWRPVLPQNKHDKESELKEKESIRTSVTIGTERKVTTSPINPQEDSRFYSIGDLAERSHQGLPMGASLLVRERLDTPQAEASNPLIQQLLAPASNFVQMWNDEKAGSRSGSCGIWRPIAPNGYMALGDVVVGDQHEKPDASTVQRCVNKNILAQVGLFRKEFVWQTNRCPSTHHVSVWQHADTRSLKKVAPGEPQPEIDYSTCELLPVFSAHKARAGRVFWHYDPPEDRAFKVYWFDYEK